MSLFSSLASGFSGLRADIGGAPAPWDDYWYSPVGGPSVAGMRVSADSVKRLSTVIAAVSAKGRAIGTMPCFMYTDLAGGGKVLTPKHPLFNILHKQPNSLQTAFEYFQMMQGHIELRGNCYSEILTSSRGIIGELMPMHPDRVRVEQMSSGQLRYIYNDPLTNNTRTLLQEEVFHVRDFADSAAVGQSRIAMGLDVFGIALAQQDYTGKYLKNDGQSGLFMTGINFKSKLEENEYIRRMDEASTGSRRHSVRMLPPGVDIKSLSIKPNDMQLLDSRKASAVEICTVFNILPHLIGVDTGKSATYASVEQFNLMHAQQCVLPMAVMWEQAIQRDLIQDDTFYAKFSLASLLRGDYATRTTGYAMAIEHGWMSPDDARELEDMNPIKGGIGKQYFRPLNWTTLDAPPQPAVLPKAAGTSAETPEEDDQQEDETGSGGDDGQQARLQGALQLMAQGTGSRCARREAGAVRKIIDKVGEEQMYAVTSRDPNAAQKRSSVKELIWSFYEGHHRFISEVFHLKPLQQMKVKQECIARASELIMYLEEDRFIEARSWIEHVAATEPMKLAALAVEGAIHA